MAAPGKCLLVTGLQGVGKTTLVIRVLESLKKSNPDLKVQGFYTGEVREGTERVGFDAITLDGPLASTKYSKPESIRWPTVGRYRVDVASFESLVLPELQVKEDTDLFIIDEVVARFRNHPGATIVTLTAGNRYANKERIYSQLLDSLRTH